MRTGEVEKLTEIKKLFGRNHVADLGRPADCVYCPFCDYPNGADACNKRNRASEMKLAERPGHSVQRNIVWMRMH